MDNFFETPDRRELNELNLVPVIDMFTTVVFFLLLSTVFIAFNKLTVPPSRVSTITDPIAPPPVAPMLIVGASVGKQTVEMQLSWSGKEPGQLTGSVPAADAQANPEILVSAVRKLAAGFHGKYPEEKTLRIGLQRTLPYQRLISVMDGVRDAMPDLVLISYAEAEARLAGNAQ